MGTEMEITERVDGVEIRGKAYRLSLSRRSGGVSGLSLFDGIAWREVLSGGRDSADGWDLPVMSWQAHPQKDGSLVVDVIRRSATWQVSDRWEVYPRGYLVCASSAEARVGGAVLPDVRIGVDLDESAAFAGSFGVRNLVDDPESRLFPRGLSLDFSTDERPVTCSVDVLLEQPLEGVDGTPWRKVLEKGKDGRFLGWKTSGEGQSADQGHRYTYRWALSWSSPDDGPNPVRGQRIYHWYGMYPRYPSDELIGEMAEYGCSILNLHMACFTHIGGNEPIDPQEMRRVVDRAHKAGIKVLFYCQPALISVHAEQYPRLSGLRTDSRLIWHSMKDTQIVFYEPDDSYDADELCLSCEEAYRYIRDTVISCYRTYGFDGLYIDWAWPAQGLCSDSSHGHGRGLYGFFNYWRLMREWREAIGEDGLMIGHGGGLLVASDFVEGFDACLTGEAQAGLDPVTLGAHYGPVPTLWTMHRRKQDVFRSARAVDELVREAATPHVGLGVMGTSILATLDPAHWSQVLVLWQIWRGFPVERSRCYTYLSDPVVEVDNSEVFHHLFVTMAEPEGERHALLVLANAGGSFHDSRPAVGVRARLDLEKLGLGSDLACRRIKGLSYETVRVAEIGPIHDGAIDVPELLLHEIVGFVLSPGDPPKELVELGRHLEGRAERMGPILAAKTRGMEEMDRMLDRFAALPQACKRMDYQEFMRGRTAE